MANRLLARLLVLPLLAAAAVPASANVLQEGRQRFQPVWSPGGIVASQEQLASQVGARVLA
jgi:gamma-glutamyltranspeptidase/glutathione hydrolase